MKNEFNVWKFRGCLTSSFAPFATLHAVIMNALAKPVNIVLVFKL